MIHSFLLIGQSNMAGRGFLHEAEAIQNDRVFVLKNGRWQPMFQPIHNDRPFAGVCLAESFADAYTRSHNVHVGLIPCADGGTRLKQWEKGSLLYDHAISLARLAMRTSHLAGILWHQGESDCNAEDSPQYTSRFIKMMESFYEDLSIESIPFLVGGLGDYFQDGKYPQIKEYYMEINRQLQEIAERFPMIGYVPADNLSANPDGLHFNSRSLRVFGMRYHDVFLQTEKEHNTFEAFEEICWNFPNELEWK